MPYCQQFKNQITKWGKELEQARVLLGEYLECSKEETGDKIEVIKQKLKGIADERQKFLELYRRKVNETIADWYIFISDMSNMSSDVQEQTRKAIIDLIDFSSMGRVIFTNSIVIPSCADYFPAVIKAVQGDLDMMSTNIHAIDYLEDIEGNFYCNTSFNNKNNKFKSARRISQIGGWLNLTDNLNIKNFGKAFPCLRKIGESFSGTSIRLSSENEELKKEIEQLINKGELKPDGRIVLGD